MPDNGEVSIFFMYTILTYYVIYWLCGSVAQLVEQRPEEPCVAGSSPAGTTIFCIV